MAKPEDTKAIVTAKNGLNLREGPGKDFGVVSVLKCDAKLAVLTLPGKLEVPGWVPVKSGKNVGWVNDKFIEICHEPPADAKGS